MKFACLACWFGLALALSPFVSHVHNTATPQTGFLINGRVPALCFARQVQQCLT